MYNVCISYMLHVLDLALSNYKCHRLVACGLVYRLTKLNVQVSYKHNAHADTHTMYMHTLQTWINTFKLIREFNAAPIIIAALSIAALIVFKICNKLLQKPKVKIPFPVYERNARKCTTKKIKWPIPIPSQLIVVSKFVLNHSLLSSITLAKASDPPPSMDHVCILSK